MLHLAEVLGKRSEKRFDRICLIITARMAGISHNNKPPTGGQQIKSLTNGSERRLRASEEGLIGTGQVAEVKKDGLHLTAAALWQDRRHVLMAEMMKMAVVGNSMRGKPLTSLLDRCCLHIKGIHPASGTDLLSKEEGIVTIAHGGVDGVISLLQNGGDTVMRPVHGRGQPLHACASGKCAASPDSPASGTRR